MHRKIYSDLDVYDEQAGIGAVSGYDEQAGIGVASGSHNKKSTVKDLHQVIKQLLREKIFDASCPSYSKLKQNLIQRLSKKDLKAWITGTLNYISCH